MPSCPNCRDKQHSHTVCPLPLTLSRSMYSAYSPINILVEVDRNAGGPLFPTIVQLCLTNRLLKESCPRQGSPSLFFLLHT